MLDKLNNANLEQWYKMTANQEFIDANQNISALSINTKQNLTTNKSDSTLTHRIPSLVPSINNSPEHGEKPIDALLDIDGLGTRSPTEIELIKRKARRLSDASPHSTQDARSSEVGGMFVRHYLSTESADTTNSEDKQRKHFNFENDMKSPRDHRSSLSRRPGSGTNSKGSFSTDDSNSRSRASSFIQRGKFSPRPSEFENIVFDTTPLEAPKLSGMKAIGIIAMIKAKLSSHRKRVSDAKEQLKKEFAAKTPEIKDPVCFNMLTKFITH